MRVKRFGKEGSMGAMTFSERVVAIALSIPEGKVTTYGRIARAAGGGNMAAQSITNILGRAYANGERNIPFHRIVYADGRVWLDVMHEKERMDTYAKEGIHIDACGRVCDFYAKLYLE